MATTQTSDTQSPVIVSVPELRAGDRLSRAEFERRYSAMPHVKKAELIEGVVYMAPPVSQEHGTPHFDLITWLGLYRLATPGVQGGDNTTVRLDLDNEPQPDAYLRIRPDYGGQSRDSRPAGTRRARARRFRRPTSTNSLTPSVAGQRDLSTPTMATVGLLICTPAEFLGELYDDQEPNS